jgi:diacylglycerol kinase (ATP)
VLVPRGSHVQPRVDVIVNRLAKKLAGETPVLLGIRAAVARSSDRARIHETRSLADLEGAVRVILERGTECVVLAGGDGSYLAGTTALHRAFGAALPTVAFAPGGTVCTVARNWGLQGDESAYAERLVDAALDGTTTKVRRPTLRVRDDRGGDRVGFIFGAGLVARFFDAYYEADTQGYASAAALVARIFVGTFTSGRLASRVLSPSPGRVWVDGVLQAPTAWSLIAASVVRDLGLHMHLLYRAAENPDAFHLVASALSARQLSPQVARVLVGRRLRGAGHVDTLARELALELSAEASTYVLDGERIQAGRVTVTAGPVLVHAAL